MFTVIRLLKDWDYRLSSWSKLSLCSALFHEDTYSFSNIANSYKMFHSWLYSKYIHLLIKGSSLLSSLLFRSTDSWTKKIRKGKNFLGSCQKPESKGPQKCPKDFLFDTRGYGFLRLNSFWSLKKKKWVREYYFFWCRNVRRSRRGRRSKTDSSLESDSTNSRYIIHQKDTNKKKRIDCAT